MSTLATATPDTVLALLRRLPPRERLHVLAQALPELECELPATPIAMGFWRGVSDVSRSSNNRTCSQRMTSTPC